MIRRPEQGPGRGIGIPSMLLAFSLPGCVSQKVHFYGVPCRVWTDKGARLVLYKYDKQLRTERCLNSTANQPRRSPSSLPSCRHRSRNESEGVQSLRDPSRRGSWGWRSNLVKVGAQSSLLACTNPTCCFPSSVTPS